MLGNVDAVHGLYYLLMHGWFQIFPPTEFWSRAPSGLAVGGAAAGVVVLGRQLSSRTVAVTSGAVFAILPRTTWAGIEARPYAFSMMAAVWLTALLIVATRRESRWLWACYGLGLAMSILLDMYLALLLTAQALRGWLQGVVQPVMFSVQAKAVGRYRQGSVVGLRQTMNRMAAIVIPPAMGAIADQWGAGSSFLILGTILLALSAPVVLITRRATRLAAASPLPQSQSPQAEAR